jgi:hypothetical protein
MDMTPTDSLAQRLRVMQIIAFAVIAGPVVLLGIAVTLVLRNGGGLAPPAGLPIVSLVALATMGFSVLANAVVTPAAVRTNLLHLAARGPEAPGESEALVQLRQTALILSLAIFEGATFLAGIAYMLEAQPWALALVAVGIVLMLMRFPTEDRVRRWLEEQREALTRIRQGGP